MSKNLALIMRSARKYKGITQQELAKALNCSQSALSKMENGVLIPSAPQWFDFCRITEIPPESIVNGFIDRSQRVEVTSAKTNNGHNLPSRYSQNRGMKVRNVVPLLCYICNTYGEETLKSFLKSHKVALDFFVDYDNQVSLNFLYDLFKYFQEQEESTDELLDKIVECIYKPDSHGSLYRTFSKSKTSVDAVKLYVENMDLYQKDFDIELAGEGSSQLELSLNPNDHAHSFKTLKDKDFCEFIEKYFVKSIESISKFSQEKLDLKTKIVDSFIQNGKKTHFLFSW